MSNPPDDPFQSRSRTVIRPRAPRTQTAGAPAPQPPPEPFDPPPATHRGAAAPAFPQPPAAPGYSGPMPASAAFADIRQAAQPPAKSDIYVPSANPITRAATSLLLLLSQLRFAANTADVAALHQEIAAEIKRCRETLQREGVPAEQIRIAIYSLCATADDIVQNLPSDGRYIWLQNSMLSQFFGERTSGVRFFEYLTEVKANPAANLHLLELMYDCLALGFEGVHRTTAGGHTQLQLIRRDTYDTIRRLKPRETDDISPHWQGQPIALRASRFSVPTWVVASVLGVVLFAVYLALRFALVGDANALAERMATLHPDGMVAIGSGYRPAPPEPPSTTQLQRIRAGLAAEIAAGTVSVDANANEIFVRVGNLLLFGSGQATVLPKFRTMAQRIAEVLEPEADWIRVVGHSDSTPIRSARFASNYELSLARAEAVAEVLREHLRNPALIQVEGKGATVPIASNKTAEGRALNRRVEVLIPRRDD